MKKMNLFKLFLIVSTLFTVSCAKTEEATVTPVTPAKLTYEANIKAIFVANCSPCHLAGGVKTNKWDDFATAKTNVTLILDRIQRDVTATGFMPKGRTTPVPAADIAKIKQWVADGLLEK